MATEAKRGFLRIAANYVRLLGNLALGLVWVPFMLNWLGTEGYGLIAFMVAMIGFASLATVTTNQSMVREIGAAYHTGDRETLRRQYNSAYLVSGGATLLTVILFIVLYFILPFFHVGSSTDLSNAWIGAARCFVVSSGVYAALFVFTTPAFCMIVVQERFGLYNVLMIVQRASALGSALLLAYGFGVRDPEQALFWYPIVMSALMAAVQLAGVVIIIAVNPSLVPSPSLINLKAAKSVLHTFGWNSAVQIAMGLYERLAMAIMNLAFGLVGSAIFDYGHRLVSYVRMAANPNTVGLDAVAARINAENNPRKMHALVHHSTRLHALVALPVGLAVFLLAEPLLRLWIGRQATNPEFEIPKAVMIVRILSISIMSRCIADSWMFILYGAGHVRKYAPMVLAGGIVGPVLGGALVFLMPEPLNMNAPAIGYALVFTIVHFFFLPIVGARCLGMSRRDLYEPLLRPALITAVSSPILILSPLLMRNWTIIDLLVVGAAFGLAYAVLAWLFVLKAEERNRFRSAALRRMPIRFQRETVVAPEQD